MLLVGHLPTRSAIRLISREPLMSTRADYADYADQSADHADASGCRVNFHLHLPIPISGGRQW